MPDAEERAYRRRRLRVLLVASAVPLLALVATPVAFLPEGHPVHESGQGFLVGLLLLMIPLAVGASAYLWLMFAGDPSRPRSWLLLRDCLISAAVVPIALLLAGLTINRFRGGPPQAWSTAYLTAAAIVLVGIPVLMAAVTIAVSRAPLERGPIRRQGPGGGSPADSEGG